MTGTKLAVNVFEESKTPEQSTPTPQPNDMQPNQNDAQPSLDQTQESTQIIAPRDEKASAQDALLIAAPWIAAGLVAIVILVALFSILRRLNKNK